MDIYVQSSIGICSEYKPQGSKTPREASVTISPLKIQGDVGDLRVISGCNLWQGCENENCHFSRAGRTRPKIEPQSG